MNTLSRMISEIRPEIFEFGPDEVNYHYHIVEVPITIPDREHEGQTITTTGYEFTLLQYKDMPTMDQCIKSLLKSVLDTDNELKLINDYNDAVTEGNTSSNASEEYNQWLIVRKEIKANVRQDFENYNNI